MPAGPDPEVGRAFEVDLDAQAGVTILHLTGDLDATTSTVVWRQLDEIEPTATVTIDLSEVGFVDSAGVGCLFKLCQRVTDADGVLVATGASPPIRSLMASTGLNRIIAILP